MAGAAGFREAIDKLKDLQAQLACVSMSDPDWRLRLIQFRRKLQEQITLVRQIADSCESLQQNDLLASKFGSAFGRMRSALALHQADWPAVKIDHADPDYVRSVGNVREANHIFITVATEAACFLDQPGTGSKGV